MDDWENVEEISNADEPPGNPDDGGVWNDFTNTTKDSTTDSESVKAAIKAVANPRIPMLILNNKLITVYISKPAETLFQNYYKHECDSLFNTLNSLSVKHNFHEVLDTLNNPERASGGKGAFPLKSPWERTLQTKIMLYPLGGKNGGSDYYIAVFFEKAENTQSFNPEKLISSLLKAVELKDNDTGTHNKRVGYYSRRIAQALYDTHSSPHVDPDFIDNITLFATMHDVGKIGTPDSILLKPGKLTSLEWDIMKEHTVNGAFILSGYPVPMAKEIALSHHEWWDGSGYPYKLAGEMIPLSARIVAIADVYDAIRMRRSYKDAFSHEEAVKIIEAHSGSHFDPSLINLFKNINGDFDAIWNEHIDDEQADIRALEEIKNGAGSVALNNPGENTRG